MSAHLQHFFAQLHLPNKGREHPFTRGYPSPAHAHLLSEEAPCSFPPLSSPCVFSPPEDTGSLLPAPAAGPTRRRPGHCLSSGSQERPSASWPPSPASHSTQNQRGARPRSPLSVAPTQCVKCSPLVLPPSRGAEMQHELIFSVGVVIQKGRSAGAGLWAERQCKTTCPPPAEDVLIFPYPWCIFVLRKDRTMQLVSIEIKEIKQFSEPLHP